MKVIVLLAIVILSVGCSPLREKPFYLNQFNQHHQPQRCYLQAIHPKLKVVPIISAGDKAPNGYRMVGIPDGLGAFDNGDQTFTVLLHHEIRSDQSLSREHGAKGAFISKWVITKPSHPEGGFQVLSGEDAIKELYLWDPKENQYQRAQLSLAKLCSADLAFSSAYLFNELGTNSKIFLGGEELDQHHSAVYGRALATIVDGPDAGKAYQLPRLGRMAFENILASSFAQAKTIAIALDDAAAKNWDTMGEVYIYIGNKQLQGNPIEQAGLNNGDLYALAVDGMSIEDLETGLPGDGFLRRFSLRKIEGLEEDDGSQLFEKTKYQNPLGATKFFRPEDGAWDPVISNRFYFVTTGIKIKPDAVAQTFLEAPGRLWMLEFDDILSPTQGGKIVLLLNGSEGIHSPDNITVTQKQSILIQEDLGNHSNLSKIWRYKIRDQTLQPIAQLNPQYFNPQSPTFITQDEESSGIIDVSHLLGNGWFLASIQSHLSFSDENDAVKREKLFWSFEEGKEIVEDGQLVAIYIPE